ncbi:hypothetical protein [Cellulophaga sp. L1A9]|uniref:hypothetical protein n=1 Tax=Cellulophaga sp. L1A9 TaxID=2686362 RepID=UPI0018EEDE68|nr:hypothetical protein [Cellulophaga sp. L1A9]
MENYSNSICSTCTHQKYCVLTLNHKNISSCDEYEHFTERLNFNKSAIKRIQTQGY